MRRPSDPSFIGKLSHYAKVTIGALVLTFVFFSVLPFIQAISHAAKADLVLQSVDTGNLPPPPSPPPEEQPEEEEQQEEEPPKLVEETAPLDLSQLELALSDGFSGGWMSGDFGIELNTLDSGAGEEDELFSIAALDQEPRAVLQPSPVLGRAVRKKAPGSVYIIFVVDKQGRVESPIVKRSSDPAFERPALAALKKWKFEPGKRNGKPVRFRMGVPITFPEEVKR